MAAGQKVVEQPEALLTTPSNAEKDIKIVADAVENLADSWALRDLSSVLDNPKGSRSLLVSAVWACARLNITRAVLPGVRKIGDTEQETHSKFQVPGNGND